MMNRIAALLLALCALALPLPRALAQGVPVYQMGTAAPGDIAVFARNGQIQGGSIGSMFGPSSATLNEPVLWGNTAGTLTRDAFGVQVGHSDTQTSAITGNGSAWTNYSNVADGITAAQVWNWVNLVVGSTDLASAPYDTARCILTPPAGTNRIVGCHGAYVVSGAPGGLGSIGYIGEFIADADGASVWGLNYLFSDNRGQTTNNNGSTARRTFFNEIDFNCTSPYCQGIGLMFGGNSTVQPTAPGFGVSALALNRLDGYPGTGNRAKWGTFLSSSPGSTGTFAFIGQVVPSGSFTASFAGTAMTVTAVASGLVGADPTSGGHINAAGVAAFTRIVSQTLPLTAGESYGGIGRYTISAAHTLGSRAVITGADSQSIIFSGYDSAGVVNSTGMQLLSSGAFLLNAPILMQLQVAGNTIGSLSATRAVFGTSVGAAIHINTAQVIPPGVLNCGTGPTIVGTDTAGTVTMGTGNPTTCDIVFNRPYVATPSCVVTWHSGPLANQSYIVISTGVSLLQTATSSNKASYHCVGIGDL